jgi:CheY-like chemotaxis protein
MEKALARPSISSLSTSTCRGWTACRFCTLRRATSEVATLPALMITTEAGEQDIGEARAVGANFYLVKPVSETDLLRHAAILTGAPL